ncbi:four helix bundle protein [Lewinella aquimaris]|uniref:Four helix bundle protein n=2 Tax=Neolewinella aquimaris TaxID=1835722 RepID=A0A840EFG1_9BACT|nr:four helix bundle protein [Neolewinella aquimaris]
MATSKFRNWLAYQKGLALAISIRNLCSTFPTSERWKLTDQITRSSRSVCANLAEAYGRRAYLKHYQAKLADCISENYETQVWLDLALAHNYLTEAHYAKYITASEEVGRLLSHMRNNPHQFTKAGTRSTK